MTPEEQEAHQEDSAAEGAPERLDDDQRLTDGKPSAEAEVAGPHDEQDGDGPEQASDDPEQANDGALPATDPETQAAEYLEGWQRARAEFSNYKKRVDRELQDAYTRATGDVITRYLTILDDLERALKDAPEGGEAARWAEGIDLIYRKLKAMIEAEGVEAIQAAGQPFDPNLHEAISHEESDELQEGYVIDVVQQGYRMGERVLRPAMVRVAK